MVVSLSSYTRGGRFDYFYCNDKYFVTEFSEFSENILGKSPLSMLGYFENLDTVISFSIYVQVFCARNAIF